MGGGDGQAAGVVEGACARGGAEVRCYRWLHGRRERRAARACAQVPGCNGDRGRSAFGATADGEVVVVGNASGDVYAYAVATGKKITQLKPGKARAAARPAAATPRSRVARL